MMLLSDLQNSVSLVLKTLRGIWCKTTHPGRHYLEFSVYQKVQI